MRLPPATHLIVHARSERHARYLWNVIARRLADCELQLNEQKTRIVCVSRSCVELAGESPVAVMTKQPCSWWAASGEILPLKPHDKVALGGEQARGPYDEESCASAVRVPARAGRSGSRAPTRWAKATEGAKTLEMQHRGTRRRIGIGTCAQLSTERERSVSAPASRPQAATLGAPGSGETYNRQHREGVECRAEVGGGRSSDDRQDNTTCRSQGPPARCAVTQRPRPRAEEPRRSLWISRQHFWQGGMWLVDCLGESRVRENFMHGSGRGCWKR